MALLLSLLLHGNIFTKFQTIYKSPKTILATIYKKLKYYFGNYLQKPNIVLATIYKSPILFWQLFTKAQILFWQLFTKGQYYFGKNNYIMLKAQKYSLAKTYFHLLKSLTHGKLNYL